MNFDSKECGGGWSQSPGNRRETEDVTLAVEKELPCPLNSHNGTGPPYHFCGALVRNTIYHFLNLGIYMEIIYMYK